MSVQLQDIVSTTPRTKIHLLHLCSASSGGWTMTFALCSVLKTMLTMMTAAVTMAMFCLKMKMLNAHSNTVKIYDIM